ncbi:MAG: TlpA family protein disulfide reductase, partial [Actinomycetota bacterium]
MSDCSNGARAPRSPRAADPQVRNNHPMRRLGLLAGVLLMLATACSSSRPARSAYPPCTPHGFTSPGEALPDCTFEGFNGVSVVRLAALRGKPTVLNFWASWCIQCIAEMPSFQKVYAALGGRVAFVGVDVLGLQGETAGAGR